MGLPIRQNLVLANKYSIKCPFPMVPTRIVVHNTANDASAGNEIAYMIRNNLQVSFHYAVDDIEAVQGIPEDRNAWHAGDGDGVGNRQGIAIEICYSKSGGDRFIQAEKNACILIAQILKKYGWGIDRVTKHQDYDGKYCPHRTLDMGWDRFLNMVQAELSGDTNWKNEAVALPNDKKKYVTNKATALYKIDTGEVVKEYPQGLEVGVDFQYKDWYLTAYSYDRNIKNGFKIQDLDLKVEQNEQPVPEDPVVPSNEEQLQKQVADLLQENEGLKNDLAGSISELNEKNEEIKRLESELEMKNALLQEVNNQASELQKKYDILFVEKNRIENEKNKAIEEYNTLKSGRFMWIVGFLEKLFPKRE